MWRLLLLLPSVVFAQSQVTWEHDGKDTNGQYLPVEVEFRIYWSQDGVDFRHVGTTNDTYFPYTDKYGCFQTYITAYRRDTGVESEPSETVSSEYCDDRDYPPSAPVILR